MGNGVIKIDGKDYNVSVTSLKRSFEVADSDATGRTADWKMHRDVVGTFTTTLWVSQLRIMTLRHTDSFTTRSAHQWHRTLSRFRMAPAR